MRDSTTIVHLTADSAVQRQRWPACQSQVESCSTTKGALDAISAKTLKLVHAIARCLYLYYMDVRRQPKGLVLRLDVGSYSRTHELLL